jgi:tetratricopeptide (TPR) repeat protein
VCKRIIALTALSALRLFSQSSSEVSLRSYFEQGEKALAEHRYADAEQAYEKITQLDPRSPEAHARLGMIYFDDHKFQQAMPSLRQSLKLKPIQPNVSAFLAMSLSELGQFKEALPGLQRGLRTAADPALKRLCGLQLERAYSALHRDLDAVQIAIELAKLYPDDPEILYHGGRLFGNVAYLSFQKLAEVAPDSSWKHQASGEAFESQGSLDLAAAEYREVLKTSPNRPGMHLRLGRVLLARAGQVDAPAGSQDQASQEFEAELSIDPSNANAAYELAEMDRKAGQFDKAAELFTHALDRYADFEEAHVGLGRVLIALGKPDQALPHLKKAVALNAGDAVAYYQLSQAEKAIGDEEGQSKALAEFRRLRSESKHLDLSKEVTPQQLDRGAEIPPP